jgi:long-chain fatty acid transport protein
MKSTTKYAISSLIAAGFLVTGGAAMATNGYFTHGVGAQSKGMAGTGVGSNANMGPIIAASNPALAVWQGDEWEIGLGIFSPRRSYTVSPSTNLGSAGTFSLGAGSYDSSSEWFPIPYVAKNWTLANDNAVTLLFYGRGGMNTDWDDQNQSAFFDPTGQGGAGVEFPGTFGAGKGGVDLSQAFLSVTYAGKTSDRFSWGIGPVLAIQLFEANGVQSFAGFTETFAQGILNTGGPVPVTSLSNNGHDTSIGWGFTAGIWGGLTDRVGFGLSYTSKMSMDEFSDYSDLFAEQGGFDIPASTKAGLSFLATDSMRINLDVEFTQFSEVTAVGNPVSQFFVGCFTANPLVAPETSGCLGGPAGAGFGWEDMTTYKLGLEWGSDQNNTWRFGYSYGEQPIQSADVIFNILAPGVMEHHLTVGWTRQMAGGGALTLSFMYAPEVTVNGPNVFDFTPFAPTTPPQNIELAMDQFEFEVAYQFGGSGR